MISQLAKNSKKEDNFGMNDDDWDVYKKIRRDQGDSDSEEEQEKLNEYEAVLKEHDPSFDNADENEEIARYFDSNLNCNCDYVREQFF